MRELTPKEIDQAPNWATHYFIAENYGIRWSNNNQYKWQGDTTTEITDKGRARINAESKPIPRKEFDITNFDFGDSDIWKVQITKHGNDVIFFTQYGSEHSIVNKAKTIALAKHFKLTTKDLL